MTGDRLRVLLQDVAAGRLRPDEALHRLAWLPVEEAADAAGTFARVDHHRVLRHRYPEVVFCPGKTPAELVEICSRLVGRGGSFLATRAGPEAAEALARAFPAAVLHARARIVHLAGEPAGPAPGRGKVLVVSAGTSDLAVAEEAAVSAAALRNPVERLYDVGVAGIHRLLEQSDLLASAGVVIAVAGMEGALASVVGGLVAVPVIAVPTSVGYGASFGGVAALLAMLSSCSAGVTVMNIDNGFGAAAAATRINELLAGRVDSKPLQGDISTDV